MQKIAKADEQLGKWKTKRRRTFISFVLIGIVVGIDYSVVFSTLFLYLKETVKTNNNEFYYGIIMVAYLIASSAFGMLTGRWVDKTRRVKSFTNVLLLLQILGSLLYTVPLDVSFLIAGRFIAGTGDSFISVCSGEVVRIYDEEESTRVLWWLATCYSVGMIIGPVVPLAFAGIDFRIGPIVVNQYNIVGLIMAILFLCVMFVVNMFMHDCSKEFDLKESRQNKDQNNVTKNVKLLDSSNVLDIEVETADITETPSALLTINKLCTNLDILLLFVSTFICMYSMFSMDLLVPLIFIEILKWGLPSLAAFWMIGGLFYILLLFGLSKHCVTNKSLNVAMLVCLFSSILMFLTLMIIKSKDRELVTDWFLVTLLGFFWLLTTCTEEVLLRAILAQKVKSSVQSFSEAVRHSISSVAAIAGALSSPLLLPMLGWWAAIMMGVVGVLTIFYLERMNSLMRCDLIEFHNVRTTETSDDLYTWF